jgi:hypothetical protein
MKKGIVLITLSLISLTLFCISSCENPVGSTKDVEINNVSFTVDTMYFSASTSELVASGQAKNTGTETITSPWYVEAQFYSDSTLTVKLGGNFTKMTVPLPQETSALWTIRFASQNVDEEKYPHFHLGDLRAIYKR